MGDTRPINKELTVTIANAMIRETSDTHIISVREGDNGQPEIHVSADGLLEIAPSSDWEWWSRGNGDKYPHGAQVESCGAVFYTVMDSIERERVSGILE